MNKYIYIIIIYLLSFQSSAYAYLDPGTGSIILTAIISMFAILSLKIRIIFSKVKKFFSKKKMIRVTKF